MEVWFIFYECRPLANSAFPGKPDAEVVVELYIPVYSLWEALRLGEEALLEEGFKVIDVDRCLRFDSGKQAADVSQETFELCRSVASTGEIRFGPFCYDD